VILPLVKRAVDAHQMLNVAHMDLPRNVLLVLEIMHTEGTCMSQLV
jgi:hypothetical protein